ncbi:T9SS type A sorting domain-containing protein [Winogradskyella thalassocola]|nr:T9SS type A sorting domain-containing protein [Winogradskyella thalassocola]
MKKIALVLLLLSFCYSNAQITTYPYSENFESGPAGWSSLGTNNSWELGNPSGFIINSAASGTMAWVTNLDSEYANNESGYVQSPIFDFSSLTEPTVQLNIWLDCGSGDGAVLQSSIDSGVTWQNVGGFNDDENWFNDDFINANPGGQPIGWAGGGPSGDTENWFTAIHDLTELIGESNVIFRMAFGSDNTGFSNDGIAFDNFKIYSQDCYAGEDTNLFACVGSSSGLLNLNDLLSEGVASGYWDQEDSNFNITNGVIDLSEVEYTDLYNFTYTVNGENNCTDSALIQLNLQIIPDAGSDNTLTICTAGEVYLYSYLDDSVSNDGIWESLNEPPVFIEWGVVDLRDYAIGSYDFKYTMTSENCGEEDSSILTIVIEALSAGEDGVLDVCDSFTEEDLFNALGGNPGLGGVWSPAINGPGNYTYTQPATTNCPETSATVVVNEIVQLSAGIDTVLESCSESSLEEFLVELGGDEGGIWSPNNYNGSGIYTYTHPSTDCTVESSATVYFSIPDPPNAGSDADVNGNFGSSDLDDLRGQLRSANYNSNVDDGIWVQVDNGSPNVLTSVEGEVDFPNTGAGDAQVYEFEYQVSGVCTDDIATVIVRIYGDDTAGTDGTLIICPGGNFSYSYLFNELGGNPSIRGYWVEDIDGPGIYTYIAQDNQGFDADEATVTVIEEELKSAGQNGELNSCVGETPLEEDLFLALGETAELGGSWEETTTGVYEYSHAATACYPVVSATVTLIEELQKSAGTDASINICEGETLTNAELFSALGETADTGGIWEETTTGVYEYSHAATTCYPLVSATVTLIEEIQKSAGENGTLEIGNGTIVTETQLFEALEGSPDLGGTWSPELAGEGTYTYTHVEGICSESSAEVVVIEGSLSIDDEDLETISVYPNPAKAVIQIRNSNTIAIKAIEVFTITGQLVMRVEDNFTEINVSKLESAMYFLQIKTEIGQQTIKFIKE